MVPWAALAVTRLDEIPVDYTFFGFQIAIRATVGSHLRAELAQLIDTSQVRETIIGKHAFWTRVCTLLRRHQHDFSFGDWDLVRGDTARAEFNEWTIEIETANATPNSLQLLPGESRPGWRSTHHILFTAVFLIERHSNSDLTVGEACDLEEVNYFTRDAFFMFLGAVTELNFASVQSDAIYVVPGPDVEGFSTETLMSMEFDYLRQLA